MMRTTASNTPVIEILKQLAPPGAVVHVGSGMGAGAMHDWRRWDVPRAVLVDAEPANLEAAQRMASAHPGWSAHTALLGPADEELDYYSASNPAESGLIDSDKLAMLWPNLRTTERRTRPAMRLDTLLANKELANHDGRFWLIIDCLPALAILRGAARALEHSSVLYVRALLQPLTDASLEEIEAFLTPLGFRCAHLVEGNHPAVGEALFVRDWDTWLSQRIVALSREKDGALAAGENRQQELASDLQAMAAELQAANKARTDLQQSLEAQRQAIADELQAEKNAHAATQQSQEARLQAIAAELHVANQARAEAQQSHEAQSQAMGAELQAEKKGRAESQQTLEAQLQAMTAELQAEKKKRAESQQSQEAQLQAMAAELQAEKKGRAESQQNIEAQLQATTAELQAEKKGRTESQQNLEAQLQAMAAELQTAKNEHAARQENLEAQLQATNSALQSEKERAANAESRLQAAGTDNTNQAATIKELRGKCEAAGAQAADQAAALATTREQIASLTAARAQANEQIAGHQQRIDQLAGENAALASSLATAQQQAEELRASRDAIADERKVLAEQLEAARAQVTELDAANRALAQDVSTWKDTGAKLAGRVEEHDRARAEQLAAIGKLESDKRLLEQEKDFVTRAQQAQEQQHAALAEAHATLSKELAGQRAAVDEKTALANERYLAIQALNEAALTQAAALESQSGELRALTAVRDQLAAEKAALDTERSNALSRQQVAETRSAELTRQLEEQRAYTAEAQAALHELTAARDAMAADVRRLEQLNHENELRQHELRVELDDKAQRQRQLAEELIRAEAQIDLIKDVLLREQGL